MNINDITITSLETIKAFSVTTGNYMFTLDELQSGTVAQSQTTSDITGKGGRKLGTLKKNKALKISGTNGYVSGGLMETQTGGTFSNKATEVLWTDNLVVNSGAATTTYKAVGTSGSEIETIYVKNSNGVIVSELTQAATVTEGKFAYAPATKALTFHTDIADGTEILVHYKRKITADVLEVEDDKFSGKATLFVDALGEDKCSNIYRIQFYIPKAEFAGELSLAMGDNQTVHSFEADALAGACGASNKMWAYTIFGVDTADYT